MATEIESKSKNYHRLSIVMEKNCIKQNDLPETSTCLYEQQTSWCTRRRSTSQSQTIWTRLSQNSRRTRDIVNATAPSTTTIHFRLDFSREHYRFLASFCVDFFVPLDWIDILDRKYSFLPPFLFSHRSLSFRGTKPLFVIDERLLSECF